MENLKKKFGKIWQNEVCEKTECCKNEIVKKLEFGKMKL
jgi:hypothetical protein